MGRTGGGEVVRFHSTVGRVAGVLYAMVVSLVALPIALSTDGLVAATWTAVLLLGLLGIFAMFLRPAVVAGDLLLLRNMLSDTEVPWHLVTDVSVRQHTTKVFVGQASYYGTGPGGRFLGVGFRQPGRERVVRSESDTGEAVHPMQTRLLDLATERAADSRGDPSRQQVVRQRSLPLSVGLVLLAAAFAVLALLARFS